MLIDFVNETINVTALQQTLTQSVQAASQDFHDGNVSLAAILSVGTVSGTTPALTVQIEEFNPTTSAWQVVSIDPVTGGGMVFSVVTTSTSRQVIKGLTNYQWIRANAVTVAGTTPSLETCVTLVANRAKYPDSAGGYDHYPST